MRWVNGSVCELALAHPHPELNDSGGARDVRHMDRERLARQDRCAVTRVMLRAGFSAHFNGVALPFTVTV